MYYVEEKLLLVDDQKIVSHLPPKLSSLIEVDKYLKQVQAHIQLQAVYRHLPVGAKQEQSVIIEGIEFNSRVLRDNLESACQVIPYLVTAGSEFDRYSSSQNMWDRYFLDTIVNKVVSLAQERLMEIIMGQYSCSKLARLSPGSLDDWPLQEQDNLFDLLDKEKVYHDLGVSLKESYLMEPSKTVSGLIFPTEVDFSSCRLCPKEKCSHRREPYDKELAQKYL